MAKERIRRTKQEKYSMIMECRKSGLSDQEWCSRNNIPCSTFYNWVSRFRKEACEIPESNGTIPENTSRQDVVRVDIVPDLPVQPAAGLAAAGTESPNIDNSHTIEIEAEGMTIRLKNSADRELVAKILTVLSGVVC